MDQKEKGKKNVEIGRGIASGGHCRLQRNVLHELWNIWGNIDCYRACDYQNNWPKNYHHVKYQTHGQIWKTIIDYHDEFEQAQMEW